MNDNNETNITKFSNENLNILNQNNFYKNNFNSNNRKSLVNYSPLKYIPANQIMEQITNEQQKDIDIEELNLTNIKRFGIHFFNPNQTYQNHIMIAPIDYKPSSGDKILIRIIGRVNKTYNLEISNNGYIYIPVIGRIYILGLTVKEIKNLLYKKLKPTYNLSKIYIQVKSTGNINVILTGFTKNPGVYTLQSLSTIKDLIIKSGGLLNISSIRNIYLMRNGKILKIIDFYKLLHQGQMTDNTYLQNNDIVFVPKAKNLVVLLGDVYYPAMYEIKDGETLKKLINYSGGLKPDASKKFIKIIRYSNNESTKVFIENYNSKFKLKNGDIIKVYKISDLNKKYIYVYGNIEHPGKYQLNKKENLCGLLNKLNYLEDTYKYYGLIKHYNGGITDFSFNKCQRIKLKVKDKIYIFNKYQILPNFYVTVKGSVVRDQGKIKYYKGMTLKDAINNAGLIAPFDKNNIELNILNGNSPNIIKFVKYKDYKDKKIKPFTTITLYSYKELNPNLPITIKGAVVKPGIYNYSKNLILKNAIILAGGFKKSAYKSDIQLVRYYIKNNTRKRKILKLNFDENKTIILKPYDEIYVRNVQNFETNMTVKIDGAVKYPGTYNIQKGDTIYDLIKRAGGFTKNAYLYGAVFTRESVKKEQEKELHRMLFNLKKKIAIISASAKEPGGRTNLNAQNLIAVLNSLEQEAANVKPIGRIIIKLNKNLKKFKNSPYNILLKKGDSLYIPRKYNTVSVMGEVINPGAFIYTKEDSTYYIKAAGGTTSLADKIYFVVHANGYAEKANLDSWFDKNIDVKPGDIITIPIKIKTYTGFGIASDLVSILYKLAVTTANIRLLTR